MLKTSTAVMIAAAVAGIFTVLSAPTHVVATPLAPTAAEPMVACAQRAWPYLNCVGTRFGNPHIRLVTTDRLAP